MPDKKALNSVSGLNNKHREIKSKSMGREEDLPDLKKPVNEVPEKPTIDSNDAYDDTI